MGEKGLQMEKSEKLNRLSSVMSALNNIEVKGRSNLINLSGSIAIIEEILNDIKEAESE